MVSPSTSLTVLDKLCTHLAEGIQLLLAAQHLALTLISEVTLISGHRPPLRMHLLPNPTKRTL